DAGFDHEMRGGHAGQQRDLLVPVLDRMARAKLELPAATVDVDFLFGQGEADATAAALALLAQLADFAQHRPHRIGIARIDAGLHARVVELRAAAHECAVYVDDRAFAGCVEVD